MPFSLCCPEFGAISPTVLRCTEADGGVSSQPAPAVRCCLHPTAGCSPSVCSSPMAPSCCLHLHSSSATAAAFTTAVELAAAWSWPHESCAPRCGAETGGPEPLDPGLQDMVTAPLLPPEEGRVENLLFLFCSVPPLAPRNVMPSPAPPAQPWSQVSIAPHTQTTLRDALPFKSGPCAPPRCPTAGTSVTPLFLLVRSLGAWLELPRPSRWLLRTIRLGYAIQFARRPPKFRGVRFTSVLNKDAPVLHAEVAVLLAKDAIELVPPAEMKSGFYSLLHHTQERRWVTTNLGPAHSEPGPSLAPVQDVDVEMHLSMHPSFRLVCSNWPEGRLLLCLDPPSTQTISPLCVRRASIPVQGPPLRAIPVASCLNQGRRGSPCPAKGSRHSRSQLPRRLSHTGPVSSTVVRTQGYSAQSPQPVGDSGQLGKVQTLPYAEDLFSQHGVGLGQPHSTSLNRACSVDTAVQEGGSTETLSDAPVAYGIHSRCHAAQIASYETASALASRPGSEMGMAPRHIPGLSHPVLPPHLQPMFGPCFSSGRSSPSASVQACCCINRCLYHGLGGHVQLACSCGALDRAPAAVAYQLPRVTGSMACSAPLQNAATREACTTLRPLRTSTTKAVYAPIACRNSPAISSFGVRSIWGHFETFMSQANSIVQPTSSHVSPPFRENGNSTPRYSSWFGDASETLRYTFLPPRTRPTASCFTPCPRGPSVQMRWLAHSWPQGLRKYAFSPVSLLTQTLCKVREDEEQVLLVAPYWPNRTWFTELMLLATAPRWQIPLRRDLLSQRGGTLWHPRWNLWNLHVWSLDGTQKF